MSTALLPVVAAAYEPRPRDWQYLTVYADLITEDGKASQRAIADKLGITQQAVQQWQKRPGFLAWVHQQLAAGREDRFAALFERMYAVALRDASVDHATWCAKVLGAFKQTDAPQAQVAPIQVNIGFAVAGVPTPNAEPLTITAKSEDR